MCGTDGEHHSAQDRCVCIPAIGFQLVETLTTNLVPALGYEFSTHIATNLVQA